MYNYILLSNETTRAGILTNRRQTPAVNKISFVYERESNKPVQSAADRGRFLVLAHTVDHCEAGNVTIDS